MSVQIRVKKGGKLVSGHEVIVEWQGGATSKGHTNSSGIYNTKASGGTIIRISSYNQTLFEGSMSVGSNALVDASD